MTSVPARLRAIRLREVAAAKGPWLPLSFHEEPDLTGVKDEEHHIICYGEGCFKPPDEHANAEFIAHARTDIPWLLALLAESRPELFENEAGT